MSVQRRADIPVPGAAPLVGHGLELILTRQLAGLLATPIFIVDPTGTLHFYNEPAEVILGCRFDETGVMPLDVWGTIFTPVNDEGEAIRAEDLPLAIAVQERRPAHGRFWILGMDGISRAIQATAFPIIGPGQRFLGAVAIFWES